ncbi:glycosyltransferase family 4 protein [Mucilaginibacter lappiensis]|uniref:Glycosyltransferase involved in cell wall biosynthesis n=1 Tax=Mucilaginibacter lappiensis TaxID=354630 RepID=A0A841JAQ3_9SPHI|nr:glycosyltransferase family 4 protein [Mucilaginibacter lappiensis]MBB6128183.1 glycosyltransferase involved in cell wall biosynthesis [Mucilaginibacter lappiensis]
MASKPSLSFYTNIPTPYQLSFFNELSKLFDLTVIYYSKTENNREWKFDLNVEYRTVVLSNNFIAKIIQKKVIDFHFSWQIFKLAWNDKSDYFIIGGSYWIPNAAIALTFNKIKRKKIAYFSEPLFEVRNKVKYAIKWLLLRILQFNCNAIFCVSKQAAVSFENFGVKLPKFIIPYNIDSKLFLQLNSIKLEEFKSKYKSANEKIILSSGSLIERKGMDVLINAVKEIDDPDLRLIIIGGGPDEQKLKDLCADDHRIIFAGFQSPDHIPYFFGIADIFAFASRYDGWAVVINEAIAANVPIISSNAVGAAKELITHPDLGLLCKSGDVQEFKNAMVSLLSNENKRIDIKKHSQKLIPLISSDYNANYVYDIFTRLLA